MTSPIHYPHSTTFLAEKMRDVCRHIVIVGIYGTSALITFGAIVMAWQFFSGVIAGVLS